MTKTNKFFSFALLLSLIASSCTSFSNPSDDPGILNKDGESQLNLNTPEAPENEGSSSSYLPSLPKLSLSREQTGAARALLPVGLAAVLGYFSKPNLTSHLGIQTIAAQAGCVAVAASSMLPKSVAKHLFVLGIKAPVGVAALTAGLHFSQKITERAVKGLPFIGTLKLELATKDADNPAVATPLLNVIKLGTLVTGSVALSPYFSHAIKAAGKKLGYIKKSKKETTEPVNIN